MIIIISAIGDTSAQVFILKIKIVHGIKSIIVLIIVTVFFSFGYLLSIFPSNKQMNVMSAATGIHGINSIVEVDKLVASFPYSETTTKNG